MLLLVPPHINLFIYFRPIDDAREHLHYSNVCLLSAVALIIIGFFPAMKKRKHFSVFTSEATVAMQMPDELMSY